MSKVNPIHFIDNLTQEHRESDIRSFSQRIGEDAGQLVANFLAGILVLLVADKPLPVPVRMSAVSQGSEELMTAYEVAELLNISKAKAYQLMSTGKIPSVQFDRTTRVRKQDLEKFLSDHIVHAT